MSLKEYNEKRNFKGTPEPEGKEAASGDDLHFVVQMHDASQLHYDFRLEMDGVLKSWAVPKGPSLNPADKRLAMRVEDHPFDYKDFEGVIPEGNYGAGNVIIWDEGTYYFPEARSREESEKLLLKGLEAGSITFVMDGHKLKGEFSLVKMKSSSDNAWLLIKKKDEFASDEDITRLNHSVISDRSIDNDTDLTWQEMHDRWEVTRKKLSVKEEQKHKEMPHDIKPMLATLVKEPFDDPDWIFEIKWDGYRTIAEIDKGRVNLYSRKGNSFNEKYSPVAEALSVSKHSAVLDGEIVILDETGRSNFQMLQNYMRSPEGELVYYVFDILYLDGKDLRNMPLIERKAILKEILPASPFIRFSDHIQGDGIDFFNAARENNQEGIMAKDGKSPYRSGSRSSEWQKIKTMMRQEVVIAGFTEPKGTRKYIGSLVLGVYNGDKLRYVGHAGGGFDTEGLREMRERLEPLIRQESPFTDPPKTNSPVTWVQPELVCEVSFSEWTDEGVLRQPIFVGLREDKDAEDVVKENFAEKETPVRKVKKRYTAKKKSPADKVEITHPDKLYFPDEGYTKGELIDYYRKVSRYILPYLKDRPHSLRRHPNGIASSSFFQKDVGNSLPEWMETYTRESESTSEDVNYLVVKDQASLLYMANMGCIEINPWFSRTGRIDYPDYLVIDLDPEDIHFDRVVETALTVKDILDKAGARCFCKTSGATGLHIYLPLKAKYDFEISKDFAHLIVRLVNQRLPDITSLERSPDKRKGKVYLDFLQNAIAQTVAAPYSVRPRPGAPVSAPLEWSEVRSGLDPLEFNIKTMPDRLAEKGDIFKGVLGPGINIVKCINNLEAAGLHEEQDNLL